MSAHFPANDELNRAHRLKDEIRKLLRSFGEWAAQRSTDRFAVELEAGTRPLRMPTFPHSIGDVVQLGAKCQMRRIHAGWGVARVHDREPLRRSDAMRAKPSQTMGVGLVSNSELAIPSWIARACPQPAAAGFIDVAIEHDGKAIRVSTTRRTEETFFDGGGLPSNRHRLVTLRANRLHPSGGDPARARTETTLWAALQIGREGRICGPALTAVGRHRLTPNEPKRYDRFPAVSPPLMASKQSANRP